MLRCVTWLNNFKQWEHIHRISSRVEEQELLNLKDDFGFQASEQLCIRCNESKKPGWAEGKA